MSAVQEAAWEPVISRLDAVVQSPTATGKTLAYVLPLCARLSRVRGSRSCDGPVQPRAVVLAPSRELVMQIGREVSRVSKLLGGLRCATVYGGCPVERSIASVRARGGADLVVATPGRLADLARRGRCGRRGKRSGDERVLEFSALETFVLDEADTLLDEIDSPEVQSFLFEQMDHDYQLVLFSATITSKVRSFAKGAMEVLHDHGFLDAHESRSVLNHTSIAVAEAEWTPACVDILLVASAAPGLALVFVRSIADTKHLEATLRTSLGGRGIECNSLHGDLDSAARRRVVAASRTKSARRRVLVCTDLAARGIDLPAVDIVVQLGIPRVSGKLGTLDTNLYSHRTGRANREGGDSPARSILLYDPAAGEAKLLAKLALDYPSLATPSPLPSPNDLVSAGLELALRAAVAVPDDVALAFHDRLSLEDDDPLFMARTLAALAGFSCAISDYAPDLRPRSLLSGRKDRATLRLDGPENLISPSTVIKVCKALGSGKLGVVHNVGASAFVDIPIAKLNIVLANFADPAKVRTAVPPGLTLSVAHSLRTFSTEASVSCKSLPLRASTPDLTEEETLAEPTEANSLSRSVPI